MRVCNVSTRDLVALDAGDENNFVASVAWASESLRLASGSRDGVVRLWQIEKK